MDEKTLAKRDIDPLLEIVSNIRELYRGDLTLWSPTEVPDYETQDRQSLTAALAYMHSRSISSLFSFYIDGDVGKDPNFMSLWFG